MSCLLRYGLLYMSVGFECRFRVWVWISLLAYFGEWFCVYVSECILLC